MLPNMPEIISFEGIGLIMMLVEDNWNNVDERSFRNFFFRERGLRCRSFGDVNMNRRVRITPLECHVENSSLVLFIRSCQNEDFL
jgi:hypothetical protein